MNSRYLRAVLSVVFVTGVAGASFYVSTKISSNKSVSPNSPDSQPFAKQIDDSVGSSTKKTSTVKPVTKKGEDNRDDPPPPTKAPVKANPTTTPYVGGYVPLSNPTNKPVVTPPPKNSGLFGSDASDYSDAGDVKIGNDGKGAIAGTYLAPDGSRHVIDLPATQKAYQESVAQKSTYLTGLSSQDLLKEAKLSCTPSKENNYCKEDIAKAQKIVFQDNLILDNQSKAALETARTQNEAVSDITNINLSKADLEKKYGLGGDPAKILGEAKITTDKIPALVETRDKLLKFFDPTIPTAVLLNDICHGISYCLNTKTRADYLTGLNLTTEDKKKYDETFRSAVASNEKIDLYLSNTSDSALAQTACKDVKGLRPKEICEDNFKRTDLLEAFDPKSSQFIAITTEKKDMTIASQYADPKFSNAALAKIYCDGRSDESKCLSSFTRETYLNSITNQSYKEAAVTNWNTNLSTLIPQVVGKEGSVSVKIGSSVIKLDASTVSQIKEVNKDTQNAFAAYAYLTQGKSEATMKTSDQLAQQFNDLLKQNPKELDKYLALYEKNPSKYTEIKTGAGKGEFLSIYKINPNLEVNALIVSDFKNIIKTSPIKGFYEDGKVVPYKNASEEYKNEARKLACEQDKSLFQVCDVYTDAINVNSVKYKESLAELDKKVEGGNYLDKLFQIKMDPVNNLSTFGSNLATVDNLSVDKEIRDKALIAAQKEINPYYNTRFSAGYTPPKMDDPQIQALANEYLNQKLVEETYTRGAGVGGALSVAVLAGAACSPGTLVASIGCGAIAGLAAAVSNFVPILGTVTAEEIAQEQQAIKDFKPSDILENSVINTALKLTPVGQLEKYLIEKYGDVQPFNNDTTAGLVQSIYSNQGAACDTVDGFKIGASCTTKDNQFALLDSIQTTTQNFGITTNDFDNPEYRAQISIQPFLNQEFDALQNENQRQAYINLAAAPIMGALSGGVGANIAGLNSTNLFTNLAVNQSVSLGNSLIGGIQAQYQFTSTVGFVDTQSEVNLEICQRQNGIGSNNCKDEIKVVEKENTEAAKTNMIIAVLSDQAIDKTISASTFFSNLPSNTTTNPTTPAPNTTPLSSALEYKNTPNGIETFMSTSELNNLIANKISNPNLDLLPTKTVINNSALNLAMANANLTDVELKATLVKAGHSEEIINSTLKIVRDPQVSSELNYLNQSFDNQRNELLIQQNAGNDVTSLLAKLSSDDAKAITAIRDRAIEKFTPKVAPVEAESEFNATLALSDNTKEVIDIVKQNKSLTDFEIATKLIEQKFGQEDIDTALSIRSDETFTNFLSQQGQGEYIALTDKINLESQRLGLTPSQYLEALENLHPVPAESQGVLALVRADINDSPITAITNSTNPIAVASTRPTTTNNEIDFSKPLTGDDIKKLLPKHAEDITDSDVAEFNRQLKEYFVGSDNRVYHQTTSLTGQTLSTDVHPLINEFLTQAREFDLAIGFTSGEKLINIAQQYQENLGSVARTADAAAFGITRTRLAEVSKDLTPQQKATLDQSLNRFSNESIKVSSVNSDGSVTYKTNSTSEFGNRTSSFKVDSNLPDTNLVQKAKAEGIAFENRSIREIQNDLDTKLSSPTKNPSLIERIFSLFRNNNTERFDHFANTDFSQSHKEILSLLPDADANSIIKILNTENGQRSLGRINDSDLKIAVDPETQKVIYLKELPAIANKDPKIQITSPSKDSLDVQIIEQAQKLKIDVNGKNVRQVMAEIEKVSAPKLSTGSLDLKSHDVDDQTTIKGSNMIMERVLEAAVDQIRNHPGTELTQVSFDNYRILTMDQNPKLKGWEKLLETISDPNLREEVRQQISRENKAQFLAKNQEMLPSAKVATIQDTLISLNKSRAEDIASIARFSRDFPDTIKNSIAKINAEYQNKGVNLKLEYPDGTTAKDFGWWDISADPKEPITFSFSGKEIIQSMPGGPEVIHGTFLTKLYDKLPTLTDPNLLPIIEQVPAGEQNSVTYKLAEKGDFEITGKQVLWKGEYALEPTPKPKIDLTLEEAKIINKYSFETATTIQDLLSVIPENQINNLGVDIMNIKTKGVTSLKAAAAMDAAVDIAGFSNISGKIAGISDTAVKANTLEGWGVLLENYQGDATNLIQAKNGGFTDANGTFHAYEHAGDGIRAISLDNMTVQGLKNLVEVSKTFDNVINRAINGELGPKAQLTAKFIRQEFGNDIFLKVGVGNTDADIHIYPGDRFNAVEITTQKGVDPILDGVKAFKKADKNAGYVVGITKETFDKFTPLELAQAGLKKVQNEHGYFITEISESKIFNPLKLIQDFRNSIKQSASKLPTADLSGATKSIKDTVPGTKDSVLDAVKSKIESFFPAKKVSTERSLTKKIIVGSVKTFVGLFAVRGVIQLFNQPTPLVSPSITPTPTAIITTTLAPTNTALPTVTYTPTTAPSPTPTVEAPSSQAPSEIPFYSQYDPRWNNGVFTDGSNFGEDACGYSVTAMILSAYSKDDYDIDPYQVMATYFPDSTGQRPESAHLDLLRFKGFTVTSPSMNVDYLSQADPNGEGTLSEVKNSLANGGVLWIGIIDEATNFNHQALVLLNEDNELVVYDPLKDKPVLLSESGYNDANVKSTNLILPPSQ